jgi:CDP-glycerol glycerophosphotransferase (TagB/SpsB family)
LHIYFDTFQLYYLAQYLPVSKVLESRGHQVTFIFYRNETFQATLESVSKEEGLNTVWVNDQQDAREIYKKDRPDWLIIGNRRDDVDELNRYCNTAMMQHGIGPKSCYYTVSDSVTTARFVEGDYRKQRLEKTYEQTQFINTGFAKLDPVINKELKHVDLKDLGLDPKKKTLLYAPTFYPSSIECLAKSFPDKLAEFNIIIKPHYFSLTKKKYLSHRKRFEAWNKLSNVFVTPLSDHSIIPYYSIADILISDASSTLFEFIALDKPAIWCDFYKLRLFYRGLFSFRMKQRLDEDLQYFGIVASQVKSEKQLIKTIEQLAKDPTIKQTERLKYADKMVGLIDGKCSQRIADYIESFKD